MKSLVEIINEASRSSYGKRKLTDVHQICDWTSWIINNKIDKLKEYHYEIDFNGQRLKIWFEPTTDRDKWYVETAVDDKTISRLYFPIGRLPEMFFPKDFGF